MIPCGTLYVESCAQFIQYTQHWYFQYLIFLTENNNKTINTITQQSTTISVLNDFYIQS